MKHWGRLILFITGIPAAVLGYAYVTLAMLFGFAHKPAFEPGLVLTAEWRPWFDRIYQFSLTLGRGICYKPAHRDNPDDVNTVLEKHERKHVWQMEDNCFKGALLGTIVGFVLGDYVLGLSLWGSAVLWQTPNFITAGLRHLDFSLMGMYRNAEHERSAYAQTDLCRALGKSWEELYGLAGK